MLYCEACGSDQHGGDDWRYRQPRLSPQKDDILAAVLCNPCAELMASPGSEHALAYRVLVRRNSTCPLVQLQRLRANEHENGSAFQDAAFELQDNDRLYDLVKAAVGYKDGLISPAEVLSAAKKL